MKKNILILFVVICSFAVSVAKADTYPYHVADNDIHNGFVTKKVWLTQYVKPEVAITNTIYKDGVSLPAHATASNASDIQIKLGLDRKRPFAIIYIPAYSKDAATNTFKRLTDFTLNITEPLTPLEENGLAKTSKTTSTNSVLATGTWFKIAVPSTGLYKVDGNLLKKMGIDITNLSSSQIRLFGNGGNMLSENNAVPRKTDLVENAIEVYDGGDGTFNQNDFFVFYAVGPTAWSKDSVHQRFTHTSNLYADSGYYFITVNQGSGLRIDKQKGSLQGNETVTTFNDYAAHELDLVNPGRIGKEWYGEAFGENPGQTTSQSFGFNFGTAADSVYCSVQVGSASSAGNNIFTITLNGQQVGTTGYGANLPDDTDPVLENAPVTKALQVNSGSVNVNINYQPGNNTATGYLNAIELNVRRPLGITGAQLGFRDWRSVGTGKIATYQLAGANSATQVWDVTNPQVPVQMNGSVNGNTYSFTQDAAMLHEFVALNDPIQLSVPTYIGQVGNQNLHGMPQADLIIVTYPAFLDAANQLADFHRQNDNIRVNVATTDQIYNEFSSGGQDMTAIRDFVKMFYDRAGNDTTEMPKNLLLFGGASYDYKNRVANNSNYVPTFESAYSHSSENSFCTDDFFGFLDDSEYIENTYIINTLDVGIGRLPVRNASDALAMVNKIRIYKSAASLGPWRINSMFVADNNDLAGFHMQDAEAMAANVNDGSKNLYNENKVYIDATPVVNTPAGDRCPNANAAIDDQVYKGAFLINYNGHGNTEVWAAERILTQDDYNKWNNPTMLPFTVTATCDFGQFDQPAFVSAGEALVVRNNGGVIAAVTTTQAVYASYNREINLQYLTAQFTHLSNGKWHAFGDAYRIGKNVTYSESTDGGELINFRKFSLLGDPALVPDFPTYSIRTDSINALSKDGNTIYAATDSLKALGAFRVSGSVVDASNNVLNDFNGTISVTLYDKPRTVRAITNTSMTYQVQDNIIYRGKATVTNGHFSYSFITPKDINYNFGSGKISSYADNGVTDAAGADTGLIVGGLSDDPVESNQPPIVKPYIGDSLFINGGITGPNTTLFVSLYDETGINVSGTEVGHDLTAVLDGNTAAPYILNSYYETAPNTYKQGYVYFPISGLAPGEHTITVRAWDVNNNYSEGSVNFVVVDGDIVRVQNLMNYPNPFRDITHFVFEHNHPNEELNVQLCIYSTAGTRVRTLKQSFMPTNSRSDEITWDGTDDAGAKLPSGVYIYRINIATTTGIQTTAYQKLVLIR